MIFAFVLAMIGLVVNDMLITRRQRRKEAEDDHAAGIHAIRDVGLDIFEPEIVQTFRPVNVRYIGRSPLAGLHPPEPIHAIAERQAAWGETTGIFAGMALRWSGTPLRRVGPREVDIAHRRAVWDGDGWRPEPVDAPLALNLGAAT